MVFKKAVVKYVAAKDAMHFAVEVVGSDGVDASSTVSFLLPVRTLPARRELTGGRVPVVNPGLFIAPRHTADLRSKHAGTGAIIVLPTLPDQDEVLPRHLTAVRMTLDAFGIADPPEFASRLQKAS